MVEQGRVGAIAVVVPARWVFWGDRGCVGIASVAVVRVCWCWRVVVDMLHAAVKEFV